MLIFMGFNRNTMGLYIYICILYIYMFIDRISNPELAVWTGFWTMILPFSNCQLQLTIHFLWQSAAWLAPSWLPFGCGPWLSAVTTMARRSMPQTDGQRAYAVCKPRQTVSLARNLSICQGCTPQPNGRARHAKLGSRIHGFRWEISTVQ